MQRRTVLAGIAATLASGPSVAQARVGMRLGVLMANAATDPVAQTYAAALLQGLGTLGWRDGVNLRIDWRWAGGDLPLLERYAAELVASPPHVLFDQASPSVAALRRKTSSIPIIFAMVTDPVGQGFVKSVGRPGGNATGFSDFDPPIAAKWLAMLTQITPPIARTTVLYNSATALYAGLMMPVIENAASSFALTVRPAAYRDAAEIDGVMAELSREAHSGLLVLTDISATIHLDAIVALAAQHRLPAVYFQRSFVLAGGLMSYGIDYADLFRRSATYIDRVLKGAVVADLPVQRPTKFELVVNLKTARTLGVTIGEVLLASADDVIE
ncbi:ABC transporter substrate-binding protein [Tardiphaga sp.]|uniref:ABC transporter substrate-binding protein n=1 Tax=Tardiphaga sp. TaxID=1926292 RepID=UPI00260E32A1|nr:ABC transporter substrate-binding protein [Tardiphaga sp.]MDB5618722.1 putative transport system substrate-binding protein [Tardiphaga sp.]